MGNSSTRSVELTEQKNLGVISMPGTEVNSNFDLREVQCTMETE
jgi:hypothetical protein